MFDLAPAIKYLRCCVLTLSDVRSLRWELLSFLKLETQWNLKPQRISIGNKRGLLLPSFSDFKLDSNYHSLDCPIQYAMGLTVLQLLYGRCTGLHTVAPGALQPSICKGRQHVSHAGRHHVHGRVLAHGLSQGS